MVIYRDGSVYDEIDKVIYQIYQDYDIRSFPIDAVDVCKKLGVALVSYSAFPEGDRWLLEKKSKQGFFVKESKELPPTIYYNDNFGSMGAIRLTIFHELKHYIYNYDNDEDDFLFERIWRNPRKYLEVLQRYEGVILPDFSLYRDMPLVMQLWNIYRSRAIGHWLQMNGVTVIPNIRYGDRRTYRAV